jgi:hypothetical protein
MTTPRMTASLDSELDHLACRVARNDGVVSESIDEELTAIAARTGFGRPFLETNVRLRASEKRGRA